MMEQFQLLQQMEVDHMVIWTSHSSINGSSATNLAADIPYRCYRLKLLRCYTT